MRIHRGGEMLARRHLKKNFLLCAISIFAVFAIYKVLDSHAANQNCLNFLKNNFDQPKPRILKDAVDLPLKLDPNSVIQPSTTIEHNIHQMYKSERIHSLNVPFMQSWVKNHPSWNYYFWTDENIRNLIVDHYPAYLKTYDSYKQPLQRADSGRYFILHHFGGVYADVDFKSIRPLDDYLVGKSCVLAPEPEEQSLVLYNESVIMTNSIMACSRGHPLMASMIASLPIALKRHVPIPNQPNLDILHTTGPQQLQNVLTRYLEEKPEMSVTIAPYTELVPTTDPEQDFDVQCRCLISVGRIGIKQTRACDRLRENNWKITDVSQAYAQHSWSHLGYNDRKYLRDRYKLVHLSKILGDRVDLIRRYETRKG